MKITLERPPGDVDLVISADADAAVGDVADALAARDPLRAMPAAGRSTLTVITADRLTLDPRLSMTDSGVRSGARIAVSPNSARYS
jgi:hypothetical protein